MLNNIKTYDKKNKFFFTINTMLHKLLQVIKMNYNRALIGVVIDPGHGGL